MSDSLSESAAGPKAARCLFLLLLFGMPLWVGATSTLAILVLLDGCFSLLLLILHQTESFYRPPGLLPFMLFCLWLLVQLVPLPPVLLAWLMPGYLPFLKQGLWTLLPLSWHPISLYPAAGLAEFLRFTAYLAFYLAATNLLISTQWQKRLLLWLSGFFGCYAFLGLVQFFAPTGRIFWVFYPWPESGRFFATYVNGNHYAALLGMVFPLLVICLLHYVPHAGYGSLRERLVDIFIDTELNRAILLALVAIIAAVSVFFSLSRSGTLTLFISSLILLLLLVGREQLRGRMLIFLSVLVAAVGLLAFFGWDPLLARFAHTFNDAGELQGLRLTIWRDSMQLFHAAPISGSGAGTYVDVYPAWQTAVTNGLVDHAHNDYIEMLTDLGLIGCGLVLWFWVQFLGVVLPAWWQRRNRLSRLICAGSFAGLSSIMLHCITDFNLVIPANGLYLFLLFALLAAASHASTRRVRTSFLPLFLLSSRRWMSVCGCLFILLTVLFYVGGMLANDRYAESAKLRLDNADAQQLQRIQSSAGSARQLAPLDPEYRYANGAVLGQLTELDASLEQYRQAVWLRPLHVEYQLQAARTLFALDQSDQAELLLQNTLKIDPSNWDSRQELATFFLAREQKAAAMQVFKAGLQRLPENTSLVLRALTLSGIKRVDFFDAMPQRSYSWVIFADFLRQLDEQALTERAYRRGMDALAVEEVPSAVIVWRYLDYLLKQKRTAEALELLRVALEVFPQNSSILARQGLLYEADGLRDRATQSFRAALMLNPNLDWVRKKLARLTPDP